MVQWFSYKRSVFSVRMTHSEYGLGQVSAELKGETQAEGVEIKRGPTEPEESSAL